MTHAFAKHVAECHPGKDGHFNVSKFRVVRTFRYFLFRQIWEAVKIHGSKATILLNSKDKWKQPVVD